MFHWINKDKESAHLSRSEGSSAAFIRHFVHARRSSKRQATTRVWPTGDQACTSEIPARRKSWPKQILSREQDIYSEISSLSASPGTLHDSWKAKSDDECAEIIESLLNHGSSVHNTNRIDGSAFDPFAATVAPVTKDVHATLTYFWLIAPTGLHHYKLEVLPEALQPFQDILKGFREAILRSVFGCKHVFYAMLAAFEMRRVVVSGELSSKHSRADMYIAMAVAAIRENLAESQALLESAESRALSLMISVQYLALAIGLNRRYSELYCHIQAMMSLVQDLRTVECSPVADWLVDGVASVCTLAAIKTGTIFPFEAMETELARPDALRLATMKYELESAIQQANGIGKGAKFSLSPAHQLPQEMQRLHALNPVYAPGLDILVDASKTLVPELGSGFVDALALDIIDHRLTMVLRDTLDNLTVAKYVWRWPERCSSETTAWLCRSNRKALHRLTSIDLHAQSADIGSMALLPHAKCLTRMAMCMRFALIIMLSFATYRLGKGKTPGNTGRLMAVLLDLEKGCDEHLLPVEGGLSEGRVQQMTPQEACHNELLFWTVMTGHFASQGQPEEQWFAAKATSIAKHRLRLRSYADLHELMSKYFYSWTVQERSLRIVASLISSD